MANKRNTKMVLASLLATSAIVPAISASAEVGGDITRSGDAVTTSVEATPISAEEGTQVELGKINFSVEDTTGQLAKYLQGPGELVEVEDKYYISFEISSDVAKMVTSATVDGESILVEVEGVTFVVIPVNETLDPVNGELSLYVAAIDREMSTKFTLTPGERVEEGTDEETGTDVEEGTDEETTEDTADVAPLKYLTADYGLIADGEYEGVEIDFVDLDDETTGYAAMAPHIEPTATLVVEDGEYFLDIKATERSNGMITDYYLLDDPETTLESIEGSKDEYPHTVRVPLVDINGYTEMAVHVYAVTPMMTIDTEYPFGIMVKPGQALTEVLPTYVYKDGTNELSIMQETYLSSASAVTPNEDGTFSVDLSFPQGQYIVGDLIFNDESYSVADSYEDGKNTVKIYTVEVDDLSKIYSATFDLDVPGFYKAKHTAQIQFGGEKNPFGDITKSYDWAYSQIVSLYNKDIFKAADTFNPANNLQRGHFALMLARAFELEVPATTPFTDLRSDVEEQNAIKALNAYGIINGKSTNTFAPADSILRYEAALMIDRLLNKYGVEADATNTVTFTDVTDAKSKEAVEKLASLQIINGKGDGKFDPNGTLTRAEMAKILDNALKIIEKQ